MKIYIVMRGENGEGGTIRGVYANASRAEYEAEQIRQEPHFLSCDFANVETFEVDETEFAPQRPIVTHLTRTCDACPSQWEGKLDNGLYTYIRFRHGWLSVGIGASVGEAISQEIYGATQDGDGFMSDEAMKEATRSVLTFADNLEALPAEEGFDGGSL